MIIVWYYHPTGGTVFEGKLMGHSVTVNNPFLKTENLLLKDYNGFPVLTLKRPINLPSKIQDKSYIVLPYDCMLPIGKRPPTDKEISSFILHHNLSDNDLKECAAYKFLMEHSYPISIREFKALLRNPRSFKSKRFPKAYKETLISLFALTSSIVIVYRTPTGEIRISHMLSPDDVDIITLLKKALL